MSERQPRIQIPYPLKGLSETYAFDQQEPGTTRDGLNERSIDPATGRTRGAQRSGLNRFLDDQLGVQSGANQKVQEIIGVNDVNVQLAYTTMASPERVFSVSPRRAGADVVDIAQDDFGNIYCLLHRWSFEKYNQDGGLISCVDIPGNWGSGSQPELRCIAVDPYQNVYVGVGWTSITGQANCRMHGFEFQLDGTYRLGWSVDSGRQFFDIGVNLRADGETDLICLENDRTNGESLCTIYPAVDFISTPTEDTTRQCVLDTTGTIAYGHRLVVADGGVVYATGAEWGVTPEQFVWKLEPYGDAPTSPTLTLTDISGIGIGIALGPTNSVGNRTIYTMGPDGAKASGEESSFVRRIEDKGTALDEDGTDTWYDSGPSGFDTGSSTSPKPARMAVDSDGYLYVPNVGDSDYVAIIYEADPATGQTAVELNSFDDASVLATYALTVPKTKPKDFPSGDSGSGIEEAEFVFAGGASVTALGNAAFFKFRMAEASQTVGTFRGQTLLAMGGGVVETFSGGSGDAFADPAGGTGVGVLDTGAPYVQSIVSVAKIDPEDASKGRFRVYITDGKSYLKYDPVDDAISDWTASAQGSIPPRCRLLELWQGRAVLARDPENPAAWHMSAIADPENWDNFPQNPNPAQAISGINAKAGDCPDTVNSLLPWDDDLLLFGGDHSIWRLTGNPMLGGGFHLVTDQTGMAFGRPWCKEPGGGVAYFMSNQCGVFALQRGGGLVRLSRDRLERRLQDNIDWSTHYVRLEWNYRDEGFHIFQLPYGAGGTLVKHWFWDRKNDAWKEDQFGTSTDTSVQPTAIYTLDGDAPSDRALLLGGEDGRIRVWDQDALSDDYSLSTDRGVGGGSDVPIDSYVTIGPIQPRGADLETMFYDLRVWLARDQDGVNYDIFVNDEPDFSLDLAPVASGSLKPGHNPSELVRFVGDSCYLRIRNALATQRWAFERATIAFAPGGMKR